MSFGVRFSARAVRDLSALPRAVQTRILFKLAQAAEDPARSFRRLKGAKTYRLRMGEHRVLADLDPVARTINVTHVGHRRNVYD